MFRHLHVRSWFSPSPKEAGSFRSLNVIVSSLAVLLLLMPTLLFSYGTAQAADGDPTLGIVDDIVEVMNGTTVSVPISFADTLTSADISALSFFLTFDGSCLTFDSITDASPANGIPDAITGLASDYVGSVVYTATVTGGVLAFSMHDPDVTQAALDGDPSMTLMTLNFGVQSSCRTTDGTTKSVFFDLSAPTFGNTSGAAVAGFATDGTYTLRFNGNPTDITFDGNTVQENVALGTTVDELTSEDPDDDLNQTHTYSLVSGDGDTDNAAFKIVGDELQTNAALNFETKFSYLIRLRTTDNLGGTYEEAFTIDITNVNEAPTSLSINTSSVNENAASGTTVGTFSSVDPDAGATATYSLVAGIGSTNNASFTVASGVLQTAAVFNYEVKNAYNIRVSVTDGDLTFENIFTIRVNDVNDAPVAVDDVVDPAAQVASGTINLTVLTNDTDQDISDVLRVSSVGSPNSGTAITTTNSISYTPAGDFNGVVTFPYTMRDNHSSGVLTDTASITLTVVANDRRGDCNSDNLVNAGDYPAFVLELADTDTTTDWYNAYTGSFPGSPMGCDANANKGIAIADLTCAVLVSFGNTACTVAPESAQAASTLADAELAVGQNLIGVPSSTVNVPVQLTTNGQNVAAASFALSFDKDQLAFDATDADQNGLPDAVTFNTPQGMVTVANYNEAAGRLELTVYAVTVPMPTLADGMVANVTLQVNEDATLTATPVALLQSSLGSDQGQAVPVAVSDGSVQIAQARLFFLPMISR